MATVLQEQRSQRPLNQGADDATPTYAVRGVTGPVFGRVFTIDQPTTVGRLLVCDIPIQEPGLSRCHVRLTPTPDGMLVQDLGSTNGTYVNGHRVSQWIAHPGDELRLDRIRFLVERPLVRSLPAVAAKVALPH